MSGALVAAVAAVGRRLWSPAALSPALWLDANVGVTQSSGAVSAWADQSGNGRNASQATGANKPTYGATAFGGSKPGVTFDGTSSFMQATLPTLAQPLTFVHVLSGYTGGTGNADLHREDGSGGPASYRNAGGSTWTMHAGAFFDTGSAYDSGACVRLDHFNGASSKISSTGTQTTGDAGTNGITSGTYNIGTGTGHSGTFAAMVLAELIVIQGTLSAAQIAQLEGYAAWKWGLQAKLPGGHTYKSAAP